MQWFYAKNGQQIGPVTLEQLQMLLSSGQVLRTDKVWREGMTDWVSAGDVPELVASAAPPAPPPPGVTTPGYTPGSTPASYAAAGATVPNYLVPAILVTLLCCLPFGIVSIVFASQVNTKLSVGDYAGAQKASAQAKLWAMIGFGTGLFLMLAYFGLAIVAAMAQR